METFISELTKVINSVGNEIPGSLKNKLVGIISGLYHKYTGEKTDVYSTELLRFQTAHKLDGTQYGETITFEFENFAKENGLVIVCGSSDDVTDFYGAINEEMSAYRGRTHIFTKDGIFPDEDQMEALNELKINLPLNKIEAVWSPKEPECSWIFKTDIPHSTFNVMEDKNLYCIGIVFHINDLK